MSKDRTFRNSSICKHTKTDKQNQRCFEATIFVTISPIGFREIIVSSSPIVPK
jgi:hypothetical protein